MPIQGEAPETLRLLEMERALVRLAWLDCMGISPEFHGLLKQDTALVWLSRSQSPGTLLSYSAFQRQNEQPQDPVCSVKCWGHVRNASFEGDKNDEGRNVRGTESPHLSHCEGSMSGVRWI